MPNKTLNYSPTPVEILAEAYGNNSKCGHCGKRKSLSAEERNQRFFICKKCGLKNYISQQNDYTGLDGWLIIFYLLNIFLLLRTFYNFSNYVVNYEQVFDTLDDTSSHTIIFSLLIITLVARGFLSIIYFTKDRLVPLLFKIYCIADIVISFIITINFSLIFDSLAIRDGLNYEDEKGLMFLLFIIRSAINLMFFLYFAFSKRVKSTFIKRKKFLHPFS